MSSDCTAAVIFQGERALAHMEVRLNGVHTHVALMRRALFALASLSVARFTLACGGDSAAPSADAGTDATSPALDASQAVDAGSDHVRVPYDGTPGPTVARTPVHAEYVSQRASVAPLMFAAGEMQISGEPFAQHFAGRDLNDYDRGYLPPDQYILNNGSTTLTPVPTTDLFGFSTAVESYEYSKYHMNMVIQQTSAGVSLADGPLVAALPGATPKDRLVTRVGQLVITAGTAVGGWAVSPAPTNNTLNYLGFPGLWPTFAPFADFDPVMQPSINVVKGCSIKGGYGGLPTSTMMTPMYECTYNTLHLPSPTTQEDRVVTPRVMGRAAWKQALWAIDFVGRIHDAGNNPVNAVNPSDLPAVGTLNNAVTATDPPGAAVGTYVGSSPLEGMWGLVMVAAMDNAAEWVLSAMTTSDGATLSTGFATKAQALAYDYTSPLVWFPASIAVTEDDTVVPYPSLTALALTDATSRSEDLAALLLGNSLFFGMTDARSVGVGQRVGMLATFDGDPFAADNGLPDGEATPHDRALAVLRVAFVDLDRMHADPTLGVLVDTASVAGGAGGTITRGTTVTTTSLTHSLIALRQTILSLNGAITQYGAADPDPAEDAKGILNPLAIHPTGGSTPLFSARVRSVFTSNAAFVRDVLTRADGSVSNGASLAGSAPVVDPTPATLESQTAAIRALIEGFLVTGDTTYRDRARAVASHLDAAFYSAAARMYRGVEGGADDVHMTPERFGWLQSSLREVYKSAWVDGDHALGRNVLEDRIARLNKLFLNGWDDLNGDQKVDLAAECLGARLQMAEQALTGELGRDTKNMPTADRDSDCVPELSHAKIGSVLAEEVHFHSP